MLVVQEMALPSTAVQTALFVISSFLEELQGGFLKVFIFFEQFSINLKDDFWPDF